MPLIHSPSRAAVGTNIKEMQAAGHPHDQAVAAALRNARQYGGHFASGGFQPPMGERGVARHALAQGFLHSTVPGRTDKLPISVSGGSYVLPADHVAALGQGNSLAGADSVAKQFKMGPYGSTMGALKQAKAPGAAHLNLVSKGAKLHFAHGGAVPIVAAGGEIIIPPEKIIERYGDLKKGHAALDDWVVKTRKKHIKQLRKLKPPRQD